MKQFIFTYWRELVLMLLALASLLVTILKRRGKVDPAITTIEERVPSLISEAEIKVGIGQGEKKKDLVMKAICDLYLKLTGSSLLVGSVIYKHLDRFVESVLATPQKKG